MQPLSQINPSAYAIVEAPSTSHIVLRTELANLTPQAMQARACEWSRVINALRPAD
jgi:hypothetical protein